MPSLLHLEDLTRYAPLLTQGLLTTFWLSVEVILTAFVVGMLVAVLRFYQVPVLSALCGGYVYVIRSIPVIMLIALIHFGVLPLLGVNNSFLLSAYVALSLSTTAYIAEILRGGFHAIHTEERDAAYSLGMNAFQRILYVFAPLAVSRMMPTLTNQFVTLIKDTSLASIIGVIELTRAAEIIYERTFHELTLLGFVTLVYFVLCYGLSCWSRQWEIKGMDQAIYAVS